jgi:hypothetical protein
LRAARLAMWMCSIATPLSIVSCKRGHSSVCGWTSRLPHVHRNFDCSLFKQSRSISFERASLRACQCGTNVDASLCTQRLIMTQCTLVPGHWKVTRGTKDFPRGHHFHTIHQRLQTQYRIQHAVGPSSFPSR